MTSDAAVAERPIVRWEPGLASLVGPDGHRVTEAQDKKVEAYLDRDLIRRVGEPRVSEAPWGSPGITRETYEVLPLGGGASKRSNFVEVTVFDDGACPVPNVRHVDYRCKCQWARGTTRIAPGTCSHTMAVHEYRQGRPYAQG